MLSRGKGRLQRSSQDDHASKPAATAGLSGRIPKVKCNEILTIQCNENAGFAGLSAIFTPSRENSYDKVQRDTGAGAAATSLLKLLERTCAIQEAGG